VFAGGSTVEKVLTLRSVVLCLQAEHEHHGSGGLPTHLIPLAGMMLVVVAGVYMFAGGSGVNSGGGDDDIESPGSSKKYPRRTAQD
jgi:hypothetical protein